MGVEFWCALVARYRFDSLVCSCRIILHFLSLTLHYRRPEYYQKNQDPGESDSWRPAVRDNPLDDHISLIPSLHHVEAKCRK